MKTSNVPGKCFRAAALFLLTVVGAGSASASVPVSDAPLFLPTPVDPNIMFIIDDSGSMHWELTPDEIGPRGQNVMYMFRPPLDGGVGTYGPAGNYANRVPSTRDSGGGVSAAEQLYAAAMRSPAVNKSYYDPSITYRPWVRPNADGTGSVSFPNASPTAARHSPVRNIGTRNLTADQTEQAEWATCNLSLSGSQLVASGCSRTGGTTSRTYFPAVYFRHTGGSLLLRSNFERIEIRSGNAPFTGDGRENRSDCTSGSCTYAQEIQNFANWYTYYRSRMLASQGGIGRAFITQSEKMRVGFGSINKGSASIDGVTTTTLFTGVRPFESTNRVNFFNNLYNSDWPRSGTPLRRALDAAGQYYSRSDNRGPWGAVPGTNDPSPHIECRQSYTILMTDGYWNDASAATAGARANVDGSAGTTITGPAGQSFTYTPRAPFSDARSDTLADVAMYYWNRDLRPDVENRVPASPLNPAFWQHMVTFGVGLGVTGSIDPDFAFNAINAEPPPTIAWGDPAPASGAEAAKLDDLLHAGVNSRGGFFSAADPETFANELSGVLQTIVARTLNSGGTAASAARRDGDFLAFIPDFDSTDWTGDLKAYRLQSNGGLGALAWSAADRLATVPPASRRVFASVPGGGNFQLVPLASAVTQLGLDATDFADYGVGVTATDVVSYLRGDHSREVRNGGTLRDRAKRIGDIVGSQPEVLSTASYGYEFLPEDAGGGFGPGSYGQFLEFKRSRRPAVFVATNNGMLHGFDARPNGGGELFAIIPNSALPFVKELPKQSYQRRFLFDGSPVQADVRLGGQWRTVLLAPTGVGGRSVMLLDVTDPLTSFDTGNLRWEFQHPGLGLTISKPSAVRLQGGRWVALFGNGVNSPGGGGVSAHKASLYAVDLQDASSFQRIQAGDAGTAADPNGMTAVIGADTDFDGGVDIIYGADYHGQVWRFDVDASGNIGPAQLLFRAVDAANQRQQITGELDVSLHHLRGQMVFFGSGRFLAEGDNLVGGTTQTQSFYAIWDDNQTVSGRNMLQEQVIQSATAVGGGSGRVITNNEVDWGTKKGWFVDLRVAGSPTRGERFIGEPLVFEGLVQFITYEPLGNPCISGGINRLYLLNALSGQRALNLGPDCPDCGAVDIREGAPVRTTTNVLTPPRPVCRPGIDPDCEPVFDDGSGAPCDPSDPACVLLPASGQGCILDFGVLLPEGLRTGIISIPCGRASWRRLE